MPSKRSDRRIRNESFFFVFFSTIETGTVSGGNVGCPAIFNNSEIDCTDDPPGFLTLGKLCCESLKIPWF
jgi:hypothetical protein